MANLITNVSKYLMILLIAIYTYYNFRLNCQASLQEAILSAERSR